MPLKNGKITPIERTFVKNMARYEDPTIAARESGYQSPQSSGWKLMHNEIIAGAVRVEARKFLDEKAGPAAVYVITGIMLDEKQPGGTRIKAGEILGKWSGIAGDEDGPKKELHEMSGDELRAEIARLDKQRDAMARAVADQAKPVIEAEPVEESIPEMGVFE